MLQEAHKFFKSFMQNVREYEKSKKRKKQIRNFSIKFNQRKGLLNGKEGHLLKFMMNKTY